MKTEKQWKKIGRVLIDGAQYSERHYSRRTRDYYYYYNEDQTRPMTEAEQNAHKAAEKAHRAELKQAREDKAEGERLATEARNDYGTAFQWLERGRVVCDDAKARFGCQRIHHKNKSYSIPGMSEHYYYYHVDNTYEDVDRAQELAKTVPQVPHSYDWDEYLSYDENAQMRDENLAVYDGRKWW